MDEMLRLQAAIGEGQQVILLLTQRCMALAGEIAELRKDKVELIAKVSELVATPPYSVPSKP